MLFTLPNVVLPLPSMALSEVEVRLTRTLLITVILLDAQTFPLPLKLIADVVEFAAVHIMLPIFELALAIKFVAVIE